MRYLPDKFGQTDSVTDVRTDRWSYSNIPPSAIFHGMFIYMFDTSSARLYSVLCWCWTQPITKSLFFNVVSTHGNRQHLSPGSSALEGLGLGLGLATNKNTKHVLQNVLECLSTLLTHPMHAWFRYFVEHSQLSNHYSHCGIQTWVMMWESAATSGSSMTTATHCCCHDRLH